MRLFKIIEAFATIGYRVDRSINLTLMRAGNWRAEREDLLSHASKQIE